MKTKYHNRKLNHWFFIALCLSVLLLFAHYESKRKHQTADEPLLSVIPIEMSIE